MLASPAAMAGASGNVGAVSNYLLRGVEQSLTSDAAIQGGLDWSHSSGAYVGTRISNTEFIGYNGALVSYETDIYGGYTFKAGDIAFDVGLLYYYYRDDSALNTLEAYAGITAGSVTGKLYYTPEYFGVTDASGDDVGGLYLTVSAALKMNDTVTVTPQIGMSSGEGPEVFFGSNPSTGEPDGEYVDYGLTLTKALDNGFSASFALVGTTLDTILFPEDKQKLVIGLKKTFDL
ncbi:MAG: TorF family putative porin [Burkholderiales bacterium]